MLGCNQDITVWVRKKIPEVNKEIFVRRVLPVKCKWKKYSERNTGDKTANIYNHVVVIIPYFDELKNFNIKEGDIVALGVYDIEITGVSPYTISEIKQLLAPNIMTVKSAACNFDINININGNSDMRGKHLRLTGI